MRAVVKTLAVTTLALSVLLAQLAVAAPPGQLKLPSFDSLADKAAQSVDVTLDASLLGLATGFLDSSKPEDAAAKDVIRGLKGIYVRSYTFDTDFTYPVADVEMVRKQLTPPGWQKLVVARDSHQHSNVDIYICVDQGRACGLAIIASEPRTFTIVNIVGAIDLQKLHSLEGKFGIPQVQPDHPQMPPDQKK
jgi:Domain of unknown function (DUF4252)